MILYGQTKVPNFAAPLTVQKDVVGLDIKVQNVVPVQKFEALHQS